MNTKRLIVVLMILLGHQLFADPPIPPKDYRWVLNETFSDEFSGDQLDSKKWLNYFKGWEGRPPAMFNPLAVSVKNGRMQIKSGVLKNRLNKYTIYGGAVTSKSKEAHFGYYECCFKASKIAMSTTFWMSNDKADCTQTAIQGDSYSQELDIQECVGGGTVHEKFRHGMNSNTHFRYLSPGAKKEKFISKGTGTLLKTEVSKDFHVYGAWWKNANEVIYYADNELSDTVLVRTDICEKPFDKPMQINMVTETYDWQPAPSKKDLLNDSMNTAYYDWVRAYQLVPVNQKAKNFKTPVFQEQLNVKACKNGNQTLINCVYKSNKNQKVKLKLYDDKGNLLESVSVKLLAGYGQKEIIFPISKNGKGFYSLSIDSKLLAEQEASVRIPIEKKIYKSIK